MLVLGLGLVLGLLAIVQGTQTIDCEVWFLDIDYSEQESEQAMVCVDANDMSYDIELPPEIVQHLDEQGSSVTITDALVDESTIYLTDSSVVDIHRRRQRRLAQKQGTSRLLVLRITYIGTQPTLSSIQLAGRIFGTGSAAESVNVVDQYRRCSFGKLNIVPASGHNRIKNGIMEIDIDQAVSSSNTVRTLENAAADQATKILGNLPSQYEHVLMVMPTHKTISLSGSNYLAYAYLNGYRSVFNDAWAGRISATQHELGHNLNIGHSGQGKATYGDTTGVMGYGVQKVGGPAVCFNAHKNWLLGWFRDRSITLRPSDLPWSGELATFVDYDQTNNRQVVLIDLTGSKTNLKLQYNRAKLMNMGTRSNRDLVAITSDTGDLQSWAQAGIMIDHSVAKPLFTFPNFSSDKAVVIEVCSQSSGPPDKVTLSIHLDNGSQESQCGAPVTPPSCADANDSFYVEEKDGNRNCAWLASRGDRWKNALCVPSHNAYQLCQETCGTCGLSACSDDSDAWFYVNGNLEYRNCNWLSRRARWQEKLCYIGHEAFDLCPATCGACD